MKEYTLGVDVGGTNIKFGLFLLPKMELIVLHEEPTPLEGLLVLKTIAQLTIDIAKKQNIQISQIKGIGLAVPCPIKNGYVESCANVSWSRENIVEELKEYLPEHIEVAAANDATMAAYGENMILDQPLKNAVFYTLGTGVGGGIIVDGNVIEGSSGLSGEIGHMKVFEGDPSDLCGCGSYGCLEQICGTAGILNYTKQQLISFESSLSNIEKLTVKNIFDAAIKRDKVANNTVERVAEYIAISASVLAMILDPDVFIIGGGISKSGDFLLDKIRKHYKKHARFSTYKTPFILAKTGNQAGAIGSAYFIKNILDKKG